MVTWNIFLIISNGRCLDPLIPSAYAPVVQKTNKWIQRSLLPSRKGISHNKQRLINLHTKPRDCEQIITRT